MERPYSTKINQKKLKNEESDKKDNNERNIKSAHISYIQRKNNIFKSMDNYDNEKENTQTNEPIKVLRIYWEELGLPNEYIGKYINNIKSLSNQEKKDIINQEHNNLKKFKDIILDLKNETEIREKNVSLLKILNNSLKNTMVEKNPKDNIIIVDIINFIKKLRINAINIISKTIALNKFVNKNFNLGKIDLKKIMKKMSYNSEYLDKMKYDLLFLQDSYIDKYIEMNNSKLDPFLTNCAPNNKNENNKITIPISDDHIKIIKEARYYLFKENFITDANINEEYQEKKSEDSKKVDNNRYNSSNYNKTDSKIKYFISNSVKKIKKENFFLGDSSVGKHVYDFKNKYGKRNRFNTFFKNKNSLQRMHSIKMENNSNQKEISSRLIFNYLVPKKKIEIDREIIKNLNNLYHFQSVNNFSKSEENKKVTKVFNNDSLKNRIINKVKWDEEIKKYKTLFENEKELRIKKESQVNDLRIILNEMSERIKEHEEEIKKIKEKESKEKKNIKEKNSKKEKELYGQILSLKKEIEKISGNGLIKEIEDENKKDKIIEENKKMKEEIELYKKKINEITEENKKIVSEKNILKKENEKIMEDYNLLKDEKKEMEKELKLLKEKGDA